MIVTPLRVPRGGSLGQPAATPRAMATLRSISVTVLLALSALVFPSHAMAQEGNLVTITGTVLDAVTNQPIQGVIVELSGQGFRFETDGRGEFTLFRIPTGNYRLELSHPDYHPTVGDFAILRAGEFTASMEPVVAGRADYITGMVGAVTDISGGTPIDRVSVYVEQGRQGVLTDVRGRFAMDDLLPGLKQVRFSALGYATRSELVEVLPDRVTNLRVSLSADPVELTPIEVTVERRDFTLQDAGYYNREAEGFGEFIDREVIEARRPAEMSDLFSRLPGVEIFAAPDDPLEKYIVLRGGRQSSFSSGPYQRCFPKVVMDGLVMNQGGDDPAQLDRLIDPGAVAGVEVFPTSAGVPALYGGVGSSCGVILIWTRR